MLHIQLYNDTFPTALSESLPCPQRARAHRRSPIRLSRSLIKLSSALQKALLSRMELPPPLSPVPPCLTGSSPGSPPPPPPTHTHATYPPSLTPMDECDKAAAPNSAPRGRRAGSDRTPSSRSAVRNQLFLGFKRWFPASCPSPPPKRPLGPPPPPPLPPPPPTPPPTQQQQPQQLPQPPPPPPPPSRGLKRLRFESPARTSPPRKRPSDPPPPQSQPPFFSLASSLPLHAGRSWTAPSSRRPRRLRYAPPRLPVRPQPAAAVPRPPPPPPCSRRHSRR